MTDEELQAWRARLKPGDRVGWHRYECLCPATLGQLSVASRPGHRCWQLMVDGSPGTSREEPWDVLCREQDLEPLPDPEPEGVIWVGLPKDWPWPVRPRRRPAARARA